MAMILLSALATGLAVLSWGNPLARLRAAPPTQGEGGRPVVGSRLIAAAGTAVASLIFTVGLGGWGLVVAAAVGAASYLVLGRLLSAAETERRAALVAELPQLCDLLAVCLEAGLPLRGAVAVLAEVASEPLAGVLGQLMGRVELGVDEATAWAEATADEPALASLGREIARAVASGMALASSVREFGVEARRVALSKREVRAKRVGVRSVLPLMVCFLPAFMLLGIVPIIGGVVSRLF